MKMKMMRTMTMMMDDAGDRDDDGHVDDALDAVLHVVCYSYW